jgi:hypothetical protein
MYEATNKIDYIVLSTICCCKLNTTNFKNTLLFSVKVHKLLIITNQQGNKHNTEY